MSHALIYIRKSVVRTGVDTLSPERQRELCLAEAKRHGWRVDRNDIYIDARGHLSGRTEQRPAWLAMRQRLAEDGDIAAVIVESLSRASRSVRDFILFVEELASRNIALISLRERFDTSGAMGKAMSAMIAVFNQLESDLASERQTDRIAARKANGRHWGLTPFGCDRKPVTGALRPSEATYQLDGAERRYYDSLYAAYNLYATGQYSQARLADELNAAGWRYRDRSGRPCRWNAQRVRNALILHRLYAGEVPAEGHIKDGRPQEWIKANFEPILPASLCHRVAAVMAERHRLHYPTPPPLAPEPPLAYPLTGLLCCAECGQPLKGARRLRPDGSFDRYYRHRFARGDCPVRRWTPADELERQISALLAALFIPPDLSNEVIVGVLTAVSAGSAEALQDEADEVDAAIARVEMEIQRLLRLAVDMQVDEDTYGPVLAERQRELDTLRIRRGSLITALERQAEGVANMVTRLEQLIGEGITDASSLRQMALAVFRQISVAGPEIVSAEAQGWCRDLFCVCVQLDSPSPVGGTKSRFWARLARLVRELNVILE